jgi:excisionase family DNA binding protein
MALSNAAALSRSTYAQAPRPPMGSMPEEMLTVAEAAARLKVHPETIRRAIRKGELRALRFGHRTVRIAPADLEAWGRGEKQGPPSTE